MSKQSKISINVTFDDANLPSKIEWASDDKPPDAPETTKMFSLAIWEPKKNAVLKTDIWTKDFLTGEMKRFAIQSIGSIGQSLFNATGDQKMLTEINRTCETLAKMLIEEEKSQNK